MNCPLCDQKLKTLRDDMGYVCELCRTISGSSKFSVRTKKKSNEITAFYVSVDKYRLINDKVDDTFALLELAIYHPKTAGPTYNCLFERKSINISPFDIEGLKEFIKTILVFM